MIVVGEARSVLEEVTALRARLAAVARLLDQPGHVTRAELSAALNDVKE